MSEVRELAQGIHENAISIARELATLKAERDRLREALEAVRGWEQKNGFTTPVSEIVKKALED